MLRRIFGKIRIILLFAMLLLISGVIFGYAAQVSLATETMFSMNDTVDMSAFLPQECIDAGITSVGSNPAVGPALLLGTSGNDTLTGGIYRDCIVGGGGNDSLSGGGEADVIIGSEGNDSIEGDAGNDLIYGEAGVDTIHGGTGG